MDLYDQFCESADLLQDMVADAFNIPRPWLKIELWIKISLTLQEQKFCYGLSTALGPN